MFSNIQAAAAAMLAIELREKIRQKNIDESERLQVLTQLFKLEPTLIKEVYFLKEYINTLFCLKEYNEALVCLTNAFSENHSLKSDKELIVKLSKAYQLSENHQTGLSFLDQMRLENEAFYQDETLIVMRAIFLMECSRFKEAYQELSKALDLNCSLSSDPKFLWLRVRARRQFNDPKAEFLKYHNRLIQSEYENILRMDPGLNKSADFAWDFGGFLLKSDQAVLALREFNKALEIKPELDRNARFKYDRSLALLRSGEKEAVLAPLDLNRKLKDSSEFFHKKIVRFAPSPIKASVSAVVPVCAQAIAEARPVPSTKSSREGQVKASRLLPQMITLIQAIAADASQNKEGDVDLQSPRKKQKRQ